VLPKGAMPDFKYKLRSISVADIAKHGLDATQAAYLHASIQQVLDIRGNDTEEQVRTGSCRDNLSRMLQVCNV
jgi:hypothetical protein